MKTVIQFIAVWVLLVPTAGAREWTDASGQRRAEAKLLGRVGETLWLEKSNGHTAIVKLERLSAADRAYALEQTTADIDPPAPPTLQAEVLDALKMKEERKQVFRLASTLAAEPLPPPPASEDADAEETRSGYWQLKYLYCGCGLNAQLIVGTKPKPGGGTVAYWHECFHRLDGLHYNGQGPLSYDFIVMSANSPYLYWSFGKHPNCCGCYPVWAWDKQMHLHFKGWECRERVW